MGCSNMAKKTGLRAAKMFRCALNSYGAMEKEEATQLGACHERSWKLEVTVLSS